jgi:hypothetical protein
MDKACQYFQHFLVTKLIFAKKEVDAAYKKFLSFPSLPSQADLKQASEVVDNLHTELWEEYLKQVHELFGKYLQKEENQVLRRFDTKELIDINYFTGRVTLNVTGNFFGSGLSLHDGAALPKLTDRVLGSVSYGSSEPVQNLSEEELLLISERLHFYGRIKNVEFKKLKFAREIISMELSPSDMIDVESYPKLELSDLIISYSRVFNAPLLRTVKDTLSLEATTSIDLSSLEEVSEKLKINAFEGELLLPALRNVPGLFAAEKAQVVRCPALQIAHTLGLQSAVEIDMPQLTECQDLYILELPPENFAKAFPSLKKITNTVYVKDEEAEEALKTIFKERGIQHAGFFRYG